MDLLNNWRSTPLYESPALDSAQFIEINGISFIKTKECDIWHWNKEDNTAVELTRECSSNLFTAYDNTFYYLNPNTENCNDPEEGVAIAINLTTYEKNHVIKEPTQHYECPQYKQLDAHNGRLLIKFIWGALVSLHGYPVDDIETEITIANEWEEGKLHFYKHNNGLLVDLWRAYDMDDPLIISIDNNWNQLAQLSSDRPKSHFTTYQIDGTLIDLIPSSPNENGTRYTIMRYSPESSSVTQHNITIANDEKLTVINNALVISPQENKTARFAIVSPDGVITELPTTNSEYIWNSDSIVLVDETKTVAVVKKGQTDVFIAIDRTNGTITEHPAAIPSQFAIGDKSSIKENGTYAIANNNFVITQDNELWHMSSGNVNLPRYTNILADHLYPKLSDHDKVIFSRFDSQYGAQKYYEMKVTDYSVIERTALSDFYKGQENMPVQSVAPNVLYIVKKDPLDAQFSLWQFDLATNVAAKMNIALEQLPLNSYFAFLNEKLYAFRYTQNESNYTLNVAQINNIEQSIIASTELSRITKPSLHHNMAFFDFVAFDFQSETFSAPHQHSLTSEYAFVHNDTLYSLESKADGNLLLTFYDANTQQIKGIPLDSMHSVSFIVRKEKPLILLSHSFDENAQNSHFSAWQLATNKTELIFLTEVPFQHRTQFTAQLGALSNSIYVTLIAPNYQQDNYSYGSEYGQLELYSHDIQVVGETSVTYHVGRPFNYSLNAYDPFNLPLTHTLISGPQWLSVDTETGELSGDAPNVNDMQNYEVEVLISNGFTSKNISLTLLQAEILAPEISGNPSNSIFINQTFEFMPQANDPQDLNLEFSITNKPSWASFDTATGTLSGTPTTAANHNDITIAVSNGYLSSQLGPFSIEVTIAAPTITGQPKTRIQLGESYLATVQASDPQDFNLLYSITNKPNWASFDAATGTLSGTPTNPGSYNEITISVSNGYVSSHLAPFSIEVAVTAPTITGQPKTKVQSGESYLVTVQASDPQDLNLTYSVTNKPDWATFDTATGTLSGTPTSAGNYNDITISVSNGYLSSQLAPFSIEVSARATVPQPDKKASSSGSSLYWLLMFVITILTIRSQKK